MKTRAAIVLQARMASTRLPGKSLVLIEGRSVFAHCVDRLRVQGELPVVLATTVERDDDPLVAEAERLDVPVVRGSAHDVLERFVLAATTFGLTELVRATADNPAVDLGAPRRSIELLRRAGAGHVVERGMPVGAAVEAVSVAALRYAAVLATDPYDREHVTPLLRRDRRFVALSALAPAALRRPRLRLTVDTPEDLDAMRRLYAAVGPRTTPAPIEAFIAAADALGEAAGGATGTRAR